jgi:hypothetical protein
MKSDTSFDSEAESIDSDKEIKEQKEDEKNLVNLDIIKSINESLSTVLEENKKLKNYKEIIIKQNNMCFSANSIPNITLYEYLVRIQKYTLIEGNTLILSVIYIDRLCQFGKITLTHYNIHRILFAAILIAIKYNEDEFYDNNYYAEIAGIKANELKFIEYNFFCISNFNLYVSDNVFRKYSRYLNKVDNKNESCKKEGFK